MFPSVFYVKRQLRFVYFWRINRQAFLLCTGLKTQGQKNSRISKLKPNFGEKLKVSELFPKIVPNKTQKFA